MNGFRFAAPLFRLVLVAVLVSAALAAPAQSLLPSRFAMVALDGDPREAFQQGALSVPMSDAVTGTRDGSLRAFAMATPDGLYAALLSTEAAGTTLVLPPADAKGADLLVGEWMAVRCMTVGPSPKVLLFALTPDGRRVCLGGDGSLWDLPPSAWGSASKTFGYTWAAEWLIPWEILGLEGGEAFRMEILRGRKRLFPGTTMEGLSRATPGAGASRWGGEGLLFQVPATFPEPETGLYSLEDFEVRPFVPGQERKPFCASRVPAGEVATAWLEWRGKGNGLRLDAGKVPIEMAGAESGKADVKISRLDFWWQAGRRTEQDALFPGRVAAGEGDVFVAERLFPQTSEGVRCLPGNAVRFVASWRVPKGCRPGLITIPLIMQRKVEGPRRVEWRIEVTPSLPEVPFLAGIYYLTTDEKRWEGDLADIANHGFNAVTCPARTQAGWERFKTLAKGYGLRGNFALHPGGLEPEQGDWAYVWDEPATVEAVRQAEIRAAALGRLGWKTWAALCWPPLGDLPDMLSASAFSPNLLDDQPPTSRGTCERWTYIQGLREDPSYNRGQMAQNAKGKNLSGVWVFCYRPEPEGSGDDWKAPPIRYDACVDPASGGSVSTVQWEALRRGVLDAKIERAGQSK